MANYQLDPEPVRTRGDIVAGDPGQMQCPQEQAARPTMIPIYAHKSDPR